MGGALIRAGVAAALIALVGMTAACSGSTSPKVGATASASGQESAWQRTLDQVQPDGSVPLATALSAFDLAIGPIPGANPPAGSSQDIVSGTIAVNWILAKWGQLTTAQQAAVRKDMGVPSGGGTTDSVDLHQVGSTTADPNLPCLTADSAGAAPYRAEFAGIESEIASHLGRSLGLKVYFSVNSKQLEAATTKMYTWACQGTKESANTGTVTGCTIHIDPYSLSQGYSDADRSSFLIHELMHCFLYDKFGVAYDSMPSWYVEGVPTWVMTQFGSGDPVSSGWWQRYLDTADASLFIRSYSALGFFAHLAETGTNVWHAIDPIGVAFQSSGDSDQAGWNAAGVTQAFLDSWGSGFATGRYPGAAWDTTGPNLPHYTDALTQGAVNNGSTLTISSPLAGTEIEQVDVNAQIVQFVPSSGASGRVSVGSGSDAVLSVAAGNLYCTAGAACTCPSSSAGDGTHFTSMDSGQQYISVSGGLKAASLKVVGMTLADACKKRSTSCLVGNWTGTGLSIQGTLNGSGGAGTRMTIDASGNYLLTFDGMSAVAFTGQSGSAGDFIYGGHESAVIVLPPGNATTGVLTARSSSIDVNSVTATVKLTAPIAYTFGPVGVNQLGSQGGSTQGLGDVPVNGATWACQGSNGLTITVHPIAQIGGQWSFTRS